MILRRENHLHRPRGRPARPGPRQPDSSNSWIRHLRLRTAGETLAEIHTSTPPTNTKPLSPRGGSLNRGGNFFGPTKLSHPEQELSSG